MEIKWKTLAIIAVIISVILAGVSYTQYKELKKCKENIPDCPDCPECPECWDCSIFDVNRNGRVNFQDAGLAWIYIQSRYNCISTGTNILPSLLVSNNVDIADCDIGYNLKHNDYAEYLYDVNCDGIANFDDVMLIWENRD